MAKKIQLRYIADPGYGRAEISDCFATSLGLGTDYPCRNGMLYLEEHCGMPGLLAALEKHGYDWSWVDCYVDDFDAWLDSDAWPNIPDADVPRPDGGYSMDKDCPPLLATEYRKMLRQVVAEWLRATGMTCRGDYDLTEVARRIERFAVAKLGSSCVGALDFGDLIVLEKEVGHG